jgi:hypothetical protein
MLTWWSAPPSGGRQVYYLAMEESALKIIIFETKA